MQRPITYYVMDNLDDVTNTYVYSGSGVAVSSISRQLRGRRHAGREFLVAFLQFHLARLQFSRDQPAVGARSRTRSMSSPTSGTPESE